MKNWYLMITDVSKKKCEELESNAKCSRFRGYLIRMYAILNLTSCVFFIKCELLQRNIRHIGTIFSGTVRKCYQFFKA